MKILTINWSISDGSIAQIIHEIENGTKGKCEFIHCYQIGEKSSLNNYLVASRYTTRFYYGLSRVIGLKYGLGILPTLKLLNYIANKKPDMIHIHCPNMYTVNLYFLLNRLKRRGIPIVITNHAEFFYTGNCSYALDCTGYLNGCKKCNRVFDTCHRYYFNWTNLEWKLMKKAFTNFSQLKMVAVSPWAYKRILSSPITHNCKISIIENSVNLEIFKIKDIISLKKKWSWNSRKILLHVTSMFSNEINHIKGGYYLLKLAEKMKDYMFIVAGNSLLKQEEITLDNVIILGNITCQRELADYYNLADLSVLTSKRETFGMVCAESLSCGTPVVGFCAGGTESISMKQHSKFVEYGNIEKLGEAIMEFENYKKNNQIIIAEDARKRYDMKLMADKYYNLYCSML